MCMGRAVCENSVREEQELVEFVLEEQCTVEIILCEQQHLQKLHDKSGVTQNLCEKSHTL